MGTRLKGQLNVFHASLLSSRAGPNGSPTNQTSPLLLRMHVLLVQSLKVHSRLGLFSPLRTEEDTPIPKQYAESERGQYPAEQFADVHKRGALSHKPGPDETQV